MRPPSLKLQTETPTAAPSDGVVGDHGAFEGKFEIERDLADVADAVA